MQMRMISFDEAGETSEPSSSTLRQAPRRQPPPPPSLQSTPSSRRYLDPIRRRSRSPEMNPVPQLDRPALRSAPWERETRTSDASSSRGRGRQRVTRFIMKRSLAEVGEKSIMIEMDALDVRIRSIACELGEFLFFILMV